MDAVEVLGAVDQLVIAAGVDDHAEDVRRPRLVHRHQPLAQRHQRPFEARPNHRQVLLADVELGKRTVKLGLLASSR